MASKQSGYPDSQNRDFLSNALHESIQKVQKWKNSCSSFSNPSDHEDFPATQPVSPLPGYAREPEEVESTTIFTNPSPNSVPPVPSLLHLSFNQDNSCFVAGTSNGIRIYSCDPFRETIRREFTGESGVGGSIGVVEMLFQSNLFALVGAGKTTEYGPNKVMIWDDHQTKYIGELWFRSEVKAVRLRRDRIIVVLENKIFVYDIRDMKLLDQIDTVANPKGLCVVSQVLGPLVLVCLGLLKGQVRVEHHGLKRTKFINAHESRIACFAITQDGHLLATASGKGTLVRIFNTLDGSLVREVRRGAVQAEIYSLAFSSSAQWLAVSSDTGTVHVFNLEVNSKSMGNDHSQSLSGQNLASSNGSSLSFLRGVLPKYFSSEWSVAQFHLNEGSHHMVGFGHEKNTLVILGMDGSFYRCKFDPHAGGEMTQLEYYSLLKPEETF